MSDEQTLQPVTFGSVIYLSTEMNLNSYMFSDGFMDNRVILKEYDGICGEAKGHHDFSFCLFMVLPFANTACFDVQKRLVAEWRDKLLKNAGQQKLEERKNLVAELKNKLESELQFNIGTLQKSKGSNICFGSSNFMLLHINSLKYLCLYQDDNNNLFLELTNNPESNCFFDFDASLKLQRGRSDNFVYEDEIVYLSCTEKFSGKSPYICIKMTDREGQGLAKDECQIIGAIDEKWNWKVNIYEDPLDESADQYMRVGAVVWVLLSEKLLFLGAQRTSDPFEELYEFQHLGAWKSYTARMKKSGKGKHAPLSRLESLHHTKRDLTEGFLEDPRKHLFDELRMQLQLTEIEEPSDKVGETEELSSFGLWKVESLTVKRGGELRWEDTYRLKHLVTGLYLSVVPVEATVAPGGEVSNSRQAQAWRSCLQSKKDLHTEFRFVPIDNLILYQNKPQSKGLIQKDSFFMIMNVESGQWVGIYDKSDSAESDDRNTKSVALYDYVKDVNTFRFKEATFQCVWENYALVSSFPVLFQILSSTMDTSKMVLETVFRKETQDKKLNFDGCYQKTIRILEFFVDFLLNRIMSNINLDQELMYPSDVRQVKFKQQYMLGLICWMLTLMFPSFEEFEKLQISPSEESLLLLTNNQAKLQKSVIKRRKGVKQTKNISYNFKVCQDHLLKKYHLSKLAYEVLQTACYQNPDNQEFVYRFSRKLSDHFGFGEFVTDSCQIIFKDNFKILHSIHRDRFPCVDEQGQLTGTEHIFQVITGRLKLFEPYRKIEVLRLLGAFTHIGKYSIYINQEKVFSSIVENKNFLFGHLLKLICEREESIIVEYRVFVEREFEQRQMELVQFCKFCESRNEQGMMEYFKAQLKLYALLCQNRNYACIKNMKELLPQKVLLKYLSHSQISDDFRAIICFMMLNLYVDKEPRTIINKPNYVRVFHPPQERSIFHIYHHHHSEPEAEAARDDDMTARFIEINLSDDIGGAYEIREWLLNHLEGRAKLAIAVQEGREARDVTNDVFNQLTYEVIRTINVMLKFGLFTQYATQLMETAMAEKHRIDTHGSGHNFFGREEPVKANHLEKLVRLMSSLLEFNYEYERELNKHDFKRTYFENQKKEAKGLLGFGGLADVGGNLFGAAKEEEEEEEEKVQRKQEQKDEYQTYQFLKRYQSLLRIIQKFTNKTYTNQEFKIMVNEDYQVLIKREICNVIDSLLDWRSDYFMENAIQYFQERFYPEFKRGGAQAATTTCDVVSLTELMPDLFLNAGMAANKKESTFRQYSRKQEVRDLDLILDRPFIEVLVMAFYFATDPEFQNALANLIFKLYTQREKLIKNIQKVSLVEAATGNQSYSKLSQLMNKLKGLISYSQSWLQIIEQNNYDEKAEETLISTLKKLRKMSKVFEEKSDDNHEAFVIKQKVFKHLGGHKIILKFIEQGTSVIDSKTDYFQDDKDASQFSYKMQFIKNVKATFEQSHRILSTFVEDNQSNQKAIYKHYGKLLSGAVNINIGQVEFLQNLFRHNQALCYDKQSYYFNFAVGLIKDHGHYHHFLKIFEVFLQVAADRIDNVEVQKQILACLFHDDNVAWVTPFLKSERMAGARQLPKFYADPPHSHLYKIAFVDCVYKCVKADLGVNFIVKVNQHMDVSTLLNSLYEECVSEGASRRVDRDGYQMKVNLCEILHIYLSKLDQAIDQFRAGQKYFVQLLDLMMTRLTSRVRKLPIEEQSFIGQHVVGLVNTYFEHFLKEIGMIALKMLSNDKAVQKEKKVFEFAQVLTDNLDQLAPALEGSDSRFSKGQLISNMVKLAKNFNLPMPEHYASLQEALMQEEIMHTHVTEEHEIDDLLHGQHAQQSKHGFQQVQRKLKAAVDLVSLSRVLPSEAKKHHVPSDFSVCWQSFVTMLMTSTHLKASIAQERSTFPDVIMSISDMFDGPSDVRLREMLISRDDVIVKLLQYIQYWKAKRANRNTIIFVLRSIRSLVSVGDQTEKEKAAQQNHLDHLNATGITLRLYWKDKQTEDQYIYQLIKFIIQLLDGGNKTIQMSILQLFKTNPDSEAFFRKVYGVLTGEMNRIKKTAKSGHTLTKEALKMQQKFIEKTLRVIQLLCEGHNNFLQDYLRQQTNSKISYDIVSLMVKLVITHRISNHSYESVLQCLETLTEVVQGPCKENQMVIVTSKFLEWSIDLLREEEKLFDVSAQFIKPTPKHGKHGKNQHHDQEESPAKIDSGGDLGKALLEQDGSSSALIAKAHSQQGATTIAIHRGFLMRLKYKCTVTLLSLLEMQEDNEEIVNRIIRSIPCSVLASELSKLHQIMHKVFGKEYVNKAFRRYEKELDPEQPCLPGDELIIEYGFNLFILTNILMLRNKKGQESDLEDIQKIITNYQFVEDKEDNDLLASLNMFSHLGNLGGALLSSGLGALKSLGGADPKAQSELQKDKERRKHQKEAFEFFAKHTAFIEVVREEQVMRMYFPLLPQCRDLPKETKQDFHENVDHSSIRDKLGNLMEKADFMIQVLDHEEDLRRLFKTSKIVELIANHKALWENLAFISNIVVNITIIASYSEFVYMNTRRMPYNTPDLNTLSQGSPTQWSDWGTQYQQAYDLGQIDPDELMHARLYQPRFWYQEQFDWTTTMITAMGIVNLCFSSLVVTFFFLKRAPLLLKDIWIEFWSADVRWYAKVVMLIKTIVQSLVICCTDFEFVYYSFFMACLVLGLIVHPFLFVFLLVDFLRISTLKIVVKAIWISKGSMFLTFLVFLLVEYYFTIIAYIYYYEDYGDGPCNKTWQCLLVTYDQTFKNGGAIGDYLSDPHFEAPPDLAETYGSGLPINYARDVEQQERFIYQVIFESSFKFILVIIIINMVAGIIIDIFGALKENMMETERNLTEFCFICGIEKEKLDKSAPHGYKSHIIKDHHMWNYVYYKAYLNKKPKTEFSGNETYIRRQLQSNEIDWFPVKRVIGVVDEEEEDDGQAKEGVLNEINIELPELETTSGKAISKVKALFEKN